MCEFELRERVVSAHNELHTPESDPQAGHTDFSPTRSVGESQGGEEMVNKKRMLGLVGFVGAGALALGLAGCAGGGDNGGDSGSDGGSGDGLTKVGFGAVGPGGGWPNANEQAIKDAFSEEAGFDLKYAPAASPTDQKSQIDAFATFV